MQKSKEMGIHVHLNTAVESIAKAGEAYTVTGKQDGKGVTFAGDLVVHGAGRTPNIDSLQLEDGEVAYDKEGITVNSFLQSVSNPHVYAAGDAANTPGSPLTPVADKEAEALSVNMLHGNKQEVDYTGTPSVVFASPETGQGGHNGR